MPESGSGLLVRVILLAAVVAGPFAFGAVDPRAYVPLLLALGASGVGSWARGHWRRAHGQHVPTMPLRAPLLALVLLTLAQLVYLPPLVLRAIAPGSHATWDASTLLPLTWRPISIYPPDTVRGLVFLVAMTLACGTAFREFGDRPWRHRLCQAIALTGLGISLVALVQGRSADPEKIYGLWKPQFSWAVFGPYVNRNHFANLVALALPLALGLAGDRLAEARRGGRAWPGLRSAAGLSALAWLLVASVLGVALVLAQSRGGLVAVGAAAVAVPLAARGRRLASAGLVAGTLLAGLAWIVISHTPTEFQTHGVDLSGSRGAIWRDVPRLLRFYFPWGSGLNTFRAAFMSFQTHTALEGAGQAHNEYLQAFADLGLPGGLLALYLALRLFEAAARAATLSALDAGLFGSIVAGLVHAAADFNLQIPANATVFCCLAGLAVRRARRASAAPRHPAPQNRMAPA